MNRTSRFAAALVASLASTTALAGTAPPTSPPPSPPQAMSVPTTTVEDNFANLGVNCYITGCNIRGMKQVEADLAAAQKRIGELETTVTQKDAVIRQLQTQATEKAKK